MRDTIHALATARGRAGVAIIRISGPSAFDVLQNLTGQVPKSHVAKLCTVRNQSGDLLDRALVLKFDEGKSFTGQAVVELHLHGGPAIVSAVLDAIEALDLSRPATAGEFTRRAFENGVMDLTEVQGLGDALDAETELQRIAAMRRLSGETGRLFTSWREKLLYITSRLEATVDFSDEDLPDDITVGLIQELDHVIDGLASQLAMYAGARKLREGFEIALIGPPNAGKSSLINYLAKREVAIVSEIPGTTRDIVEAKLDLAGLPVTFLDTAGLRETNDVVEQLGVSRAKARAEQADLRIWLSVDGTQDQDADISLKTKGDLDTSGHHDAVISTVTGQGIDRLLDQIASELTKKIGSHGDISREYERQAFRVSHDALVGLRAEFTETPVEIILDGLYEGIRGLEVVLGRIDVEDMLGEVFSSFCIGK